MYIRMIMNKKNNEQILLEINICLSWKKTHIESLVRIYPQMK
jgi:hypothetical protein